LALLLAATLIAAIASPPIRALVTLRSIQRDHRGLPLVAPFDAPRRRQAIAWREIAFTGCPPLIAPTHDLVGVENFYTDAKQSVRDETKWLEGRARVKGLREFGIQLGRMSSDQLLDRHPDPARAECMARHLESWANADALTGEMTFMTSSNRAWFVVINAATALIILKQDKSISPDRAAPIERWLAALAWSVLRFDDDMYKRIKETPRYPNNHVYWAGAAAVTAGVAAQDVPLFLRGIENGRAGLNQVDRAGFLSGELWRGARAFRYTLWGAGPLALIVRYAEANGIPLASANHGALVRLSEAIIATPRAPQAFERAAGIAQAENWSTWPSAAADTEFAELIAPLRLSRPTEALAARYRPVFSQMLGGNLTILYGDPAQVRHAIERPGARLVAPPL
jgi:poly(beta-D-mannuronate) lyase